jgi:hypothetical protein
VNDPHISLVDLERRLKRARLRLMTAPVEEPVLREMLWFVVRQSSALARRIRSGKPPDEALARSIAETACVVRITSDLLEARLLECFRAGLGSPRHRS